MTATETVTAEAPAQPPLSRVRMVKRAIKIAALNRAADGAV